MKESKEQTIQKRLVLKVNLDGPVGQFMTGLQHLLDLILFTFAGAELVENERYDNYSRFLSFHPAQNNRLDFQQVKNEYEKWLIRNFLGDAISYAGAFLEECKTICAIYDLGTQQILREQYNKIVTEEKDRFSKLGLPGKLTLLKDEYGVFSEFESNILELNKLRNCIVHRLGIVSKRDVNEGDQLVVHLRALEFFAKNPETEEEIEINKETHVEAGWLVVAKWKEECKSFKLGESVSLSYQEMIQAINTFYLFASSMKKSIIDFLKARGIPVKETPKSEPNQGS